MSRKTETPFGFFKAARFRGVLCAVLCGGILTGCSSVPDALNPVEWYRDTRDWITGADEPEAAKATPKPSTADSKDFPKLSTVPPRPQPPTAAERKQLTRSLAADRDQARYSDEIIRRQTDSSGRLTESAPAPTTIPKLEDAVPRPAPATAAASAKPPSMPAPASVPSAPPFPPMPAAPPSPPQMAEKVLPMASPAAGPSMPQQPAMAAPPMPQQSMAPPPTAQPAMTAPPMPQPAPSVPAGSMTFGPPPADIALNTPRPAAPNLRPLPGTTGQPAVAPNTFSARFPAGTESAPRSFSMAPGQPLGTIRFGVGSAALSGSARAAIGRMARTVRQSRARVRVVGHASSRTRNMDPMSHHMANFKVSLDRANAVARELRRHGVDPAAITVEAVSDTDPAYIEVMPAGEAGNRRVVVLIEN